MEEKELDVLLKSALKVKNCTPPDIMPALNEAHLKSKEGRGGKERKQNGRK